MNLPVFDCLIDENLNDESGIYAISFVDAPANDVEFVALSAQKRHEEFLSRNDQKQVLTGVVLRPGQLIYRHDKRLGDYYIRFSADEIEKIACKMMKTGVALYNTTHQHHETLTGNYLSELWIVEDSEQDKSCALGFEPLPKGTLMCSYKIGDRNYWNTQVMSGLVKGFSLEGRFFRQAAGKKTTDSVITQYQNSMKKNQNKKQDRLWSKLSHLFLDMEQAGKADATGSGTASIVFVLANGKEALVDADGFTTVDGKQLPAGEHLLADGNLLVVDGDGQFIETKEQAAAPDETSATAAPQTLSKEMDGNSQHEPVESLKAKIIELECKLSELAELAQAATAEVQELRKTSPSAAPATAGNAFRDFSTMKRYEQIASTLNSAIRKR
jgi:hypothetical protein